MSDISRHSFAAPIVSQGEAARVVASWKKEGKRVVALSGSFDIFHAGHVTFLNEARAQGDALVVFLNNDVSVRMYKGMHRPVVPEAERAALVSNVRAVDLVVPFDEPTPLSLIQELKPDVYVNGSERGEYCVERVVLDTYGGKLHLVSKSSLSSSRLIERIVTSQNTPARGVVFIRASLLGNTSELRASLIECSDAGFHIVILSTSAQEELLIQHQYQSVTNLSMMQVSSYLATEHEDFVPAINFFAYASAHDISLDKSWIITNVSDDIRDGRLTNMNIISVGLTKTGELYQPHFCEPSVRDALHRMIA